MLTLSYLQRSSGREGGKQGGRGGCLEAERILGGNYETTRAPSAGEEGRGLMAATQGRVTGSHMKSGEAVAACVSPDGGLSGIRAHRRRVCVRAGGSVCACVSVATKKKSWKFTGADVQ